MTRRLVPSAVLLAFAASGTLFGCSAHRHELAPPGLAAELRGAWVSPLAREHPLVGRVFDVARGESVGAGDLRDAVVGADVVLLGEQHDNVDHHRLQAAVLREMVAAGLRPAVAFEQLDLEDQPAVDAVLRERGDADAAALATTLADRVDWANSGWPPFDEYREIFEVALDAGLDVRAANLSRQAMSHVLSHAEGAGSQAPSAAAPRVELPDAQRAIMAAGIEESHCGYANERMVAAMIEAQRRRDDVMARVLADACAEGAAVLVAGFGHARGDHGVPLYLRDRAPGARIVSVGFLEVLPDLTTAAGYADVLGVEQLPFDYVVFTPRGDDEDPCEKFREGLEKMRAAHGASPATRPPGRPQGR